MSPPLPSSLTAVEPANPRLPGKVAIKTERESIGKESDDNMG